MSYNKSYPSAPNYNNQPPPQQQQQTYSTNYQNAPPPQPVNNNYNKNNNIQMTSYGQPPPQQYGQGPPPAYQSPPQQYGSPPPQQQQNQAYYQNNQQQYEGQNRNAPVANVAPQQQQQQATRPNAVKGMGWESRTNMGYDDFKYPLFGCCSHIDYFCYSCFCPCIVAGMNAQRSRHLDAQKYVNSEFWVTLGFAVVGGFFFALPGVWVAPGLYNICQRSRIRNVLQFEPNTCGDIFVSTLCCACALTQQRLDLEDYEAKWRRESGPNQQRMNPYN